MADFFDLSDTRALTLAAPEHGQTFYRDARQKGLALRVTANGARAYVVLHWDAAARRELRFVLGHPPALSVAAARKAVQARIGAAIVGQSDPFGRAARRKSELTLAKVLADYLAARPNLKPRTREDYRSRIEHECFADWLERPLVEITRDDIERRYVELVANSESRAKGAMVVLRALFNFALAKYESGGQPILIDNPIRRLSATRRGWSRVKRRANAIPLALMPAFLRAARAWPGVTSDYLQAVALTGLRRSEAARLEWAHVDLERGVFTIVDTKNKDPLHLPITRQLREIFERRKQAQRADELARRYVFAQAGADAPIAEPRKTLDALCEAIGHPSTVHDLRRSFLNAADSAGLGFLIMKLLVNHRLPTGSEDVTVGYAARDPERLREAAQRVADVLDGSAQRPTVTRLRAQRV